MPRKSKGARLYERSSGIFAIRDGARFVTTGTRDRRQAEEALAAYIAGRDQPFGGPTTPEKLTIADALAIYGEQHGPTVRARSTIGYSMQALLPILGALPVASTTGAVCRRYAEARGRSPGTVRRELGVLQAAMNYCAREGYLTSAPKVTLPPISVPRDRWLTRNEVAKLLKAAYRNPKARHLSRFIICAAYSGTRSSSILGLSFMPHTQGGHVDTEKGILYRRATGKAETKKRTPPIPIPRRLLAHLRRWERMGARYVVEIDGQRVASVKTAWRRAIATAGIDPARPHDLRHTAATWMMQRGADKWAAAGFLGMGLEMLEKVYGHHHPDHLRSAVEAMERRSS